MVQILIFLAKTIIISLLLYGLYLALFRGKASYGAQRTMLLLIPLVATIASLVSADLIAIEREQIAKVDTLIEQIGIESEPVTVTQSAPLPIALETTASPAPTLKTSESSHVKGSAKYDFAKYKDYAPLVLWALVSLVMTIIFISGLRKILRLRRYSSVEQCHDYTLYRLGYEGIIFSFWRGIYMSKAIHGEKFDLILRHELGHIRNRHYVDKLIVEIYRIVLWFNPFINLIRRELSLIHEYEADLEVLRGNCDVQAYKHFIFEEATSQAPTFANGLNSSQIKMRFIKMKNNYKVRHRGLRALMTVVVALLISASMVVYVQAQGSDSADQLSLVEPSEQTNTTTIQTTEQHQITEVTPSSEPTPEPAEEEPTKTNATVTVNGSTVSLESTKLMDEFNKMMATLEVDPNNINKISIENGNITLTESDGTTSMQISIDQAFEELEKAINEYDNVITEYDNIVAEYDNIATEYDNIATEYDNTVADMTLEPTTTKPKSKDDYYTMQPGDYRVVKYYNERDKYRSKNPMYQYYVIRHKEYTQVDFVVTIAWDTHWITLESNSYLLDRRSKDRYLVHSYQSGAPTDEVLYFKGLRGKTVVLTSIFPPLDKRVKSVDLIEIEAENIEYPSSGSTLDELKRNLKVYDSVDDLPYGSTPKEPEGRVIELDENFKI